MRQSRGAVIESLIAAPPADIAELRALFSRVVSRQWEAHVASSLLIEAGISTAQTTKARFVAEMYARACYSMLFLSASGPTGLRAPVRAATMLPLSRNLAVRFAGVLLRCLHRLVPQVVHRQLLLMSTLMGILDIVLDEAASSGEAAVLRIARLLTAQVPAASPQSELLIAFLVRAIRKSESAWQLEYWQTVLHRALREYCLAEGSAVAQVPDCTGMGHRTAGIEAAIKCMWYVVGPWIGLRGNLSRLDNREWNREQRWMANTGLLLQMIDDWVDQDEDRGVRLTAALAGDWNAQSVEVLYGQTVRDLAEMLTENRIHNRVLQDLFLDLYNDHLHFAIEAMSAGTAA